MLAPNSASNIHSDGWAIGTWHMGNKSASFKLSSCFSLFNFFETLLMNEKCYYGQYKSIGIYIYAPKCYERPGGIIRVMRRLASRAMDKKSALR